MKICLIIHSLGIGGMERVMVNLANYFADQKKADVHLLLIGRKRNIEYKLSDKIHIHKPSFSFNNDRRAWHTIKTIRFARLTVKLLKPDTILSFGEFWNNLVLLSLLGIDAPVFISDRSEPDKELGKVQNRLRDWLYPKAAGYIAQTSQAKEVANQNKWNKYIRVIGNPIREFPENPEIKKENVVLFVGRLIKTKHVDQLIQMFHEVRQPGWRLEIVGGDAKGLTLSDEYQQLINDLGAEGYISLEGERKNVEDYYNKSKIFAFTSSSEGFPNVVGEALSAGLPVIAYDCMAGPSDLISDGKNGCLVPVHDTLLFKQRLKEVMTQEELRDKMSIEARRSVFEFEKGKIADEFYDFITAVK